MHFFLFSVDIILQVCNWRHVYIFIWITSHEKEKRNLCWCEYPDFMLRQIVNPFGTASISGRQILESLIPCLQYAICSWGTQVPWGTHGICIIVDTGRNDEKSEVIQMTDFSHHHEKCQLPKQAMVWWQHNYFKALPAFLEGSVLPYL